MIWQIQETRLLTQIKAKTTQINYGENYVYQAMWRQAGKHEMEIDKHPRRNQEELSLKCCKFETFVDLEYFKLLKETPPLNFWFFWNLKSYYLKLPMIVKKIPQGWEWWVGAGVGELR